MGSRHVTPPGLQRIVALCVLSPSSTVPLLQKRRTTAGQVPQTTPDARRSATLIATRVHMRFFYHAIHMRTETQPHDIIDDDHDDHPDQNRDQKTRQREKKNMKPYLSPRRVGRDRRHVLDSADTHTRTGERTERALCSGAGRFCAGTTSGPEFDVKCSDTDFTAACCDILSSQHGSVWRRLVTIGLDLHSTF